MQERIARNLREVREKISESCAKVGRDPSEVRLVVVTKMADIPAIQALLQCGESELGENRVQQLLQRAPLVDEFIARNQGREVGRARKVPESVRWHMVGHLQRNKVKQALPAIDLIHSVDTLRLAEQINKLARAAGIVVEGLLQVNCSQEEQKHGMPPAAAPHMVDMLSALPNLRLRGLMTMAAYSTDVEESRRSFARLREIFEDIVSRGEAQSGFDQLSMGMSLDYPVAVEEGATLVRVGTAVFTGLQ